MDSAVAYEAIDVGSNPSRSAVERLDCLSFYMYTNYNRKRGTVMAQKRLRLKPNKHIESSSLTQHTKTTFVIGLDYDVKGEITWTSAVIGILEGIYTPFKVHETKRVRSAGGDVDMAWPIIVRLNYWVEIPHRKPVDLSTKASRYDILRRDGWTCAYCGAFANTVDHILPESRGGAWSWGNLVAACVSCADQLTLCGGYATIGV